MRLDEVGVAIFACLWCVGRAEAEQASQAGVFVASGAWAAGKGRWETRVAQQASPQQLDTFLVEKAKKLIDDAMKVPQMPPVSPPMSLRPSVKFLWALGLSFRAGACRARSWTS